MKIINYLMILTLGLSFSSCYLLAPGPSINLQSSFDGKDIAVLDFAVRGMQFSQKHGVLAADRLTTSLLLSNKFTMIERARVRDAQKVVGISSATPISADQMQKIGLRLKARYLVIGDIYQYANGSDFSSDDGGTATVSFRILNAATGEIAGVVTHSISYSDSSPDEMISKLIAQITKKLTADDK